MIHKFNNLKYTLIRDLLQSSHMRDSTKASMLAFKQETTSEAQISIGIFSLQWASQRKSRNIPIGTQVIINRHYSMICQEDRINMTNKSKKEVRKHFVNNPLDQN